MSDTFSKVLILWNITWRGTTGKSLFRPRDRGHSEVTGSGTCDTPATQASDRFDLCWFILTSGLTQFVACLGPCSHRANGSGHRLGQCGCSLRGWDHRRSWSIGLIETGISVRQPYSPVPYPPPPPPPPKEKTLTFTWPSRDRHMRRSCELRVQKAAVWLCLVSCVVGITFAERVSFQKDESFCRDIRTRGRLSGVYSSERWCGPGVGCVEIFSRQKLHNRERGGCAEGHLARQPSGECVSCLICCEQHWEKLNWSVFCSHCVVVFFVHNRTQPAFRIYLPLAAQGRPDQRRQRVPLIPILNGNSVD